MRNSKFEMHFAQQSCVCFFKIKTGITVSLEYDKFWNLSTFFPKKLQETHRCELQSQIDFGQKFSQQFYSRDRKLLNVCNPWAENYPTMKFQGLKMTFLFPELGWINSQSLEDVQAGVSFGSKMFGSKQLWWLRCHPSFYFQQELPPPLINRFYF